MVVTAVAAGSSNPQQLGLTGLQAQRRTPGVVHLGRALESDGAAPTGARAMFRNTYMHARTHTRARSHALSRTVSHIELL